MTTSEDWGRAIIASYLLAPGSEGTAVRAADAPTRLVLAALALVATSALLATVCRDAPVAATTLLGAVGLAVAAIARPLALRL